MSYSLPMTLLIIVMSVFEFALILAMPLLLIGILRSNLPVFLRAIAALGLLEMVATILWVLIYRYLYYPDIGGIEVIPMIGGVVFVIIFLIFLLACFVHSIFRKK